MNLYCGIDLGARNSHFCIVDELRGGVVAQRRIPNDPELILEFLDAHGQETHVVVESTFNWYWLVDLLQHVGYDVTLAHTVGLKAITTAKVKTDRRDAQTLAQLHRLGAIPESYIYPREQREVRDLLRRRQRLVAKRGDEYGSLRRLMMRHGRLDHSRASITKITAEDLAEVFDSGSGIAAEDMGSLFEPFFSTKEIGRGSGLGLAISKNIIEGYGGDISVESEVGKGTSFTLRIPIQKEAEATEGRPIADASSTTAKGRILIVDDEDPIRSAMVRMLRGHETVEASSGAAARQLLEKDQGFDLILCDMMMPAVSGMDLHQWLVANHPVLAERLIFVTGGAFTPKAREYLSKVDNLRLEKPFDVANFKKIVNDRLIIAKGAKS